ncbi:hypothetical protein CDCA_CDCA08G2516 [Cyanidium caldarium]|uniref:Arf-GAP domain-containing protein n=1 Tax=Cyanidium caldarium TaxID=2771 RepID=A0AAV9IWK0_CYACA|nr:hypothetical protein CDCA_CDCA08G2516 [Cyanidium caldarium]|eukprot:ctg_818.g337
MPFRPPHAPSEHEQALRALLADPANAQCAECHEPGPRWASVNLGVFLCIQCSGLHRGLGVHVSQVRSVNLDRWSAAQVEAMRCVGNARAAELWEARLPDGFRRPAPGDLQRLRAFIEDKYVQRKYATANAGRGTEANHRAADAVQLLGSEEASSAKAPAPEWSWDAKAPSESPRTTASAPAANPEPSEHVLRKQTILALYGQSNNITAPSTDSLPSDRS